MFSFFRSPVSGLFSLLRCLFKVWEFFRGLLKNWVRLLVDFFPFPRFGGISSYQFVYYNLFYGLDEHLVCYYVLSNVKVANIVALVPILLLSSLY